MGFWLFGMPFSPVSSAAEDTFEGDRHGKVKGLCAKRQPGAAHAHAVAAILVFGRPPVLETPHLDRRTHHPRCYVGKQERGGATRARVEFNKLFAALKRCACASTFKQSACVYQTSARSFYQVEPVATAGARLEHQIALLEQHVLLRAVHK